MLHPRPRLTRLLLLMVLATIVAAAPAFAQGGAVTTSLSGTVTDSSGAVIPGADITVTNNGTGATFTSVTGANGTFAVPALNPGSYSVKVALMGFKTVVLNNITLNAAVPGSVRVRLEVGALEETVLVQAGSEIVQTAATAVATTLSVKQITNLPLNSRSALDFVAFLPGVDTATTVRNSTVNGLPQSAINITIDGMNVQDNYLKTTDGFFTRVTPRLDAIEEVTFTSAAQGADSGGQGAVQIRFSTRSGTNRYQGSGYYYYRNDRFNHNTWFNARDGLPTPVLDLKQPGFRMGGPISIPKLFDGRNKAFFFFNYEWLKQPVTLTRNRTVLTTAAQQGIFQYGTTQVNLLQLAAATGNLTQVDPTVAKLLGEIRASTATTGAFTSLANPAIETYTWQPLQTNTNKYPTVRLDFNLTGSHRLSFSTNYQHILAVPDGSTNSRDPRFPGFPHFGIQDSKRYTWQTSLRSTFGKSLVNEIRVGSTGGATQFNPNYSADMWGGSGVGNTNGYHLNINGAMGITNVASSTTPSAREAKTQVIEDAMYWVRGNHNFAFGGSFTRVDLWLENQTLVPTVNFGLATGDPALTAMFAPANFPGSATADVTNAQNLYALLTGRITSITREARIDAATDKYVLLGPSKAEGRMQDMGFYVQDSWKLRRNLTLNLGVRYELQLPFSAINNSYSTATIADIWGVTGVGPDFEPSTLVTNLGYLFQPGMLKGMTPTYKQFTKGTKAYNTDLNNIAPNIGVAWTPGERSGFLGRLVGKEGDTVLRGGYTTAYQRNGMGDFSDVFGGNPGIVTDATRNQSLGNLGTVPLLFSNSSSLGAPPIPESRTYPMLPPTITGSVNIFDPDLQVPYAKTWSFGIQRAISRDSVVEVRYTGARNYAGWTAYNYNELNIIENGFLNEFKAAQANLQANIGAGRGNTFKYAGPGTGTSPLPIYLAYFSGTPASQAGDASKYTSTNFGSSNYYNALAILNPNPFTPAGTSSTTGLQGSSTFRANALAAGLPANFFLANPDMLGGANITGNGGYTKYNGATVEVRRRMSQGLAFGVSYTYGVSYGSSRFSFRKERVPIRQAGDLGGVEHALKLNWTYELPFGRGKRWLNSTDSILDRIVGGWTFLGSGRVQSGRLLDFGNVRIVGFTEDDLHGMFQLRYAPDSTGKTRVWMLPQEVIDNTVKAFNVSATSPTGYGSLGAPTGQYFAPANSLDCIETVPGYGDCGARSVIGRGPTVARFDVSVSKQVPIKGRVNFEFQAQVFNVFNRTGFTPITGFNTNSNPGLSSSTASTFEITTLADLAREVQFVFRINF